MKRNAQGEYRLSRRQFLGAAALGMGSVGSTALAAALRPAADEKRTSRRIPPLEMIALSRLAFGPTSADLADFRSAAPHARKRMAAFVERQLHPESIDDKACSDRLSRAGYGTLDKKIDALWADHVVAANAMRDKALAEQMSYNEQASKTKTANSAPPPAPRDDNKLRLQPLRELEAATWTRAVFSRRQLSEIMAGFWRDHFNIYAWDPHIAPVFPAFERDVIRRHLFGNFREMIEDVSKSPAMLFYLDNALSQSANPNENYARELFELHTLGAENYLGTRDREEVAGYASGAPVGYVDGDVYEAARAFTGWRVADGRGVDDTGAFLYFEPWHDRFQKIILGRQLKELQSPMKDGRDVLDMLADHPGTARHISRKLCRRLVCDDPPLSLVDAAANIFHEHQRAPDQIRRVVRHIALSDEFRTTWGRKMRRPFESTVAMLRAVDAEFSPSEAFLAAQGRAGQRLFQWRTPDGYPDSRERWGGVTPTLERWRTANFLTTGAWQGIRVDAIGQTPPSIKTPLGIARHWIVRLIGNGAPNARVLQLADFLSQGRNPRSPLPPDFLKERLPAAISLALMSPEFQLS